MRDLRNYQEQVYRISGARSDSEDEIYMMKLPVNAFERALEKSRYRIIFCRNTITNWEDIRECVEFAVDKVIDMGTTHDKSTLMNYCMGVLKMESEVISKAIALFKENCNV